MSGTSTPNRWKQMPLARLLPALLPILDEDQAMQLSAYTKKLKKNEISPASFNNLMRCVAGDQMIERAVRQLEDSRSSANAPNQSALQSQVSIQQQNLPTPSADLHEVQLVQLEQEREPTLGLNWLQPQPLHMQFEHAPILTHESSGGIQHQQDEMLTSNIPSATSSKTPAKKRGVGNKKPQPQPKPQHMQLAHMPIPTHESAGVIQHQPDEMLSSNMPSATSAKTPTKKPRVGQKKRLEDLVSSPTPSRKKQKVSDTFLDQSIKQLNDVAAVSGVNIREEEEQLFSSPKRDSLISEAHIVQEEEDSLILEKIPLQQKLKEIVSKCGLKGISNDVERCLSLCVEERICGLIGNLIRLSKQRLDVEKPRHRTVVSSDIRHQIMVINREAQDEWKKKQAEAEKLQKQHELECNPGADGEKEEDDCRGKAAKPLNKAEDDTGLTTAANIAARAALGGDDVHSKWLKMAEISNQKCGGTNPGSGDSGPQPGENIGQKKNASKGSRGNRKGQKRCQSHTNPTQGGTKKGGRSQGFDEQPRTISVKDVIAALESWPQMSKSTLIFKLYVRIPSDAATAT